MAKKKNKSSKEPVWHLQRDVENSLLWKQLTALHEQLAQRDMQLSQLMALHDQLLQSNRQLTLQQNQILYLQAQLLHRCLQRDADDQEPLEAKGRDDEWIFVDDVPQETVTTEGAPPYCGTSRSEEFLPDTPSTASGSSGTGSPVSESEASVATAKAPATPAALWLRLPVCQDQRGDRSCDVPEARPSPGSIHAPRAARGQEAGDESPAAEEPIVLESVPPPPAALWSWPPSCQDQRDQSCDAPEARPSPGSIRMPLGDASGYEVGDEPPVSEDAHDEGRQHAGDGQVGEQLTAAAVAAAPVPQPSAPASEVLHTSEVGDLNDAAAAAHAEAAPSTAVMETVISQALGREDADISTLELLITAAESVPNLLPYLSVQELLNWRLLSRCTSNHEALIAHVAEMGSMRRPETMVTFMRKDSEIRRNPDTPLAAAFAGDAAQQKLYQCWRWCAALAYERESKTTFPESHVHRIVVRNLRCLLLHSRSEDEDIADRAGIALSGCAEEGLPFVRSYLAEATLARLPEIIRSSTHALERKWCIHRLVRSLETLSVQQCQQFLALLVRILRENPYAARFWVLWGLQNLWEKLWQVDDDPRRTYEREYRLLRSMARTEDPELQTGLRFLEATPNPPASEWPWWDKDRRKRRWLRQQWRG
ncbi:HISN7 [Symbiodinium sp. CCMP2592]|nr:HISN7 [Symbiodinium sp. CCMP2592]